jgi:hypothetical protein
MITVIHRLFPPEVLQQMYVRNLYIDIFAVCVAALQISEIPAYLPFFRIVYK